MAQHSNPLQPQLLPTKLYCLPTLPHLVPRPHLLQQLNQSLYWRHSLTLLVAPAGFGKTSLIGQWIAALESGDGLQADFPLPKFCCLSLDSHDNELMLFLHYVVGAIRTQFPAACANTLHLLQALRLAPVPHLTTTLLQDLAALEEPCVLVLEDYHVITESTIHQVLLQLLDRLPRHIHLVLLSRTTPPLPLARLRVQQQMTELRTADLCFSSREVQAFLTQALGKPPAATTVATLHTQTEGWIAGLQLAALALRGQADERTFVQTIATTNWHTMDYLMEEVLTRQPPAVQQFLLRTALFDRFCAPLDEALAVAEEGADLAALPSDIAAPASTPVESQAILAYLVQANLFIVALDDRHAWYRYHYLFRALLRHQLHRHCNAAGVATLHRRASVWLAANGWIEEAVQHALASGDDARASAFVAQPRHALLNQEEWHTLARRLALLPDALIAQQAALLVTQAWILNVQFKLGAIPPLLQAAAARLDDPLISDEEAQCLQGELDCLWAQHWYWQHDSQRCLAATQRALAALPATCLYARSAALLYWGLAAHAVGRSAEAIHSLQITLEAQRAYPSTFVARILFALTLLYYLSGKLTLMAQTAHVFLRVSTEAKLVLTQGWAHYLLGIVYYEWNDIAQAIQHFTVLVEQRYTMHTLAVHNGWLGLAWSQQGQGEPLLAQQQVAALLQFHQEMNNS
ncbi:MAG: hypothetical protein KF832_25400, partial [Caldilineaceae bacterium]|nr:hypothetical protein [Caldilineaceae bacterium]